MKAWVVPEEVWQEKVAQLEAENGRLREQADRDGTERYVMNEELMAKSKENERLRAALRMVVKWVRSDNPGYTWDDAARQAQPLLDEEVAE